EIKEADDSHTVLQLTAKVVGELNELSGDIIRVIVETAPHEETAAQTHETAIQRCREALAIPAQRLASIGALKEGLDVPSAVDILWFYFGFGSRHTLVHQNGWAAERAERWLMEQVADALVKRTHG